MSEQNDQQPLERAGSFRRSFRSTTTTTSSSLRNELQTAAVASHNRFQPITVRASHHDDDNLLYELEPTGPADRTFKIVFTGDAAVGKSSFISRLYDGVFIGHTTTTLGIRYR